MIHGVKRSKICNNGRQRDIKKGYGAGILLLENMTGRMGGRTANLSKLRLIRASTSIILQPASLALLPTASWTPCLHTILVMSLISKRKQNKPSVLEIFHYQNETNRFLSRFSKFEVERIVDPRNFCYQNEASHLVPQIFRIEVEQTNLAHHF